MGLGIGKECQRCGDQLNYEDGFNSDETLCRRCDCIVKYDENRERRACGEEDYGRKKNGLA